MTDEQLTQILDINSRDIGKAKGKADDQKAELENLRSQLEEKDKTIASLEKAGGDIEAIQKELDGYKKAEADRKKAEKEAETDRILTAAAEQALEGKEFVNDPTRAHYQSTSWVKHKGNEKKEEPTMKVSCKGFTGELVSLELSPYCAKTLTEQNSDLKHVRFTRLYDLSIHDSNKGAAISFAAVKLKDIKFMGVEVSLDG